MRVGSAKQTDCVGQPTYRWVSLEKHGQSCGKKWKTFRYHRCQRLVWWLRLLPTNIWYEIIQIYRDKIF